MIPGVTIVIPVYNRAEVVGCTLESVKRQTVPPVKVVLVDNNSTDGSLDVLHRWQADNSDAAFAIEVISESKPGAAAARNAGLARVDTEWTMFFDSDDTMRPDHLADAMRVATEHSEARIIGWDVCLYGLDGTTCVKRFANNRLMYNNIIHGNFSTQRYMARTQLFRLVGGWDESVMVWNDIELGTRLLLSDEVRGARCGVRGMCGNVGVDVFASAVSITGTDFSHNAEARSHSLDCMARNLAGSPDLKWIAVKRMMLAALCARETLATTETVAMLRSKALDEAGSAWRRALLKALYTYVKHGGRGGARIISLLL